jgi:predicted DCC family thiol-disulfide oxidoreductase YuxK
VTVYYDGACPLCRREIAFYRDLKGADTIDWVNVANCNDEDIPANVSRAQLLGRFHIQMPDQSVKSGAAAFVEIWQNLPAFRPFARLAQLPGAMPVLEVGYRFFLKFRPTIQKLVSRVTNDK